jgi:Mannosyltransferase (PIG-V)
MEQLATLPRSAETPAAKNRSLKSYVAHALDAVIVVYALIVVSVLTIGGFDLPFFSATHLAKPVLLLILLVPTRAAIGGHTWLTLRVTESAGTLSRVWAALPIPVAVRDVIFTLIVTRVATFAVALAANVLVVPDSPRAFSVPLPWQKFAETYAVWDSGWYFDIASRGYFFSPDSQSSIAFFPLYPLLVRLCAAPFGGSPAATWIAAIAVSWMAFFCALVALHQLTERLVGTREAARRTVLYIAVFPFSIYFTRVYTEGLFLLLTVLSVRAAVDARWLRAGILGGLATITRPNGILIGIPLLIFALTGRPSLRTLSRRLAALSLVPLALAGYSAYVYTLSGNPLGWLDTQRHWGYSLSRLPHRHLLSGLSAIEQEGLYAWFLRYDTAPFDFFYVIVALIFLALVPGIVRRFGWGLGLYVLVSLLIPLSGNALIGIGRYASVLFPAFMLVSTVGSPRVFEAILIVSITFRTLFLTLLISWYPLH